MHLVQCKQSSVINWWCLYILSAFFLYPSFMCGMQRHVTCYVVSVYTQCIPLFFGVIYAPPFEFTLIARNNENALRLHETHFCYWLRKLFIIPICLVYSIDMRVIWTTDIKHIWSPGSTNVLNLMLKITLRKTQPFIQNHLVWF